MNKLILSTISICLVACSSTTQNQLPENTFQISQYETTQANINSTPITLAIANTPQLQAKGFMTVKNIPENQGMIFTYDEETIRSFWMKNTYVPLDIIFLNKDFQIINIHHQTPPCIDIDPDQLNCPTYSSTEPSQYIIELPSPQAKNLNLQPTQQINITL